MFDRFVSAAGPGTVHHARHSVRARVFTGLLGLLALLPLGAQAGDGTAAPISNTEGSSRVEALAAGWQHSCGLKADGSVACWGKNSSGQTNAPDGQFVSVSPGWYHSCGLKADGSVACWGNNQFDQANAPDGPFVSVSAGEFHTCGVKTDASVACWGGNQDHQTEAPAGPFLSVSASKVHSCGLKADGSVACWGDNSDGQLNGTPDANVHAGTLPGRYVSLTAGYDHSCGLKADGSVTCWGSNIAGQAVDQGGPFVSVSAGSQHTCGLKADGSVACWGSNTFGQVSPQDGIPAGPYVSLSAGTYHTCGLRADGSVTCWGAGEPGTSGNQDLGQSTVPANLGPLAFGQIAAGNAHGCEVKRNGTLSCWGDNSEGQTDAPSGLFTQVVAGDANSCAIGADGKVTCWGLNAAITNANSFFAGFRWQQLAAASNGDVCGLMAGDYADLLNELCTSGSTGAVGSDYYFRNITHPKGANKYPYGVLDTGAGYANLGFDAAHTGVFAGPWKRLESGLNHQCGLKADGSIECWGNNLVDRQLDNMPASTEKFRAFSVGYNHACAIRGNGELACWGSNINGQASPPSGTFVQVAAGNIFTCGLRDSGIRVCWGAGAGVAAILAPGSLPDGIAGTAYADQQFSVSGALAPANAVYGVSSGSLPDGLDLSASGLLSGTPTHLGTFSFSIDAEGDGDFGASHEYSITIADGSAPLITYTLNPDPADGDNGWYTGNVTVTWTVVDPESSATIDSGCGTNLVDTLDADTSPAGVTFSCSASSAGGSTGPVSVTLKRDGTDPTMSIAPASPANGNDWYNTDVSVLANCGDATPGSGVASCPSVPSVTAEGTTTVPAQTVQDNAGNTGSSNTLTINLDKTAPTVSAAATNAPDGNNGWYVSNVGVAFTCSDATSGIASCPANQTLSAEGSAVSSTAQTASDNAGNSSAASNVVTVMIDKTPPTLAPTVPDPLLRDGSYVASPNASDATSGLANASCGPLDTSSTGSFSTTCSATDNAGNSNSVALSYTVGTTCANDGYRGTQLTWCKNICENGLSGQVLDTWIHRWTSRYRDVPYCRVEAD